jgi:hypothetical protein
MLILAGACLFGAFSQGPDAWWESKEPRSHEHAEAIEESFTNELHSTAGLAAALAARVLDGEYDAEYLPVVKFIAETTDDGVRFRVIEGKRSDDDPIA